MPRAPRTKPRKQETHKRIYAKNRKYGKRGKYRKRFNDYWGALFLDFSPDLEEEGLNSRILDELIASEPIIKFDFSQFRGTKEPFHVPESRFFKRNVRTNV